MQPARLGVGVIGAGRVGPVLGAALAAAGHTVVGIHAIGDDSRDRAAALLPGVPLLEVPEIVERAELVLLAVPRAELAPLVQGLADAGLWQPGQIVLHTDAHSGTDVLRPAAELGAVPLAVHPAMAFTGTSIDLAGLVQATCAVTAPSAVLPIGQALVVEMGAEPVVIEEGDRPVYAEAISIATEFSDSIVSQAAGMLAQLGIERPGRVLGQVVRSSVETALARSYDAEA